MDVYALMEQYRGRLTFHGGLSTQKILPFGSVQAVQHETGRLLAAGRQGSYILAPAHDVEGDVPLENMLAFIEMAQAQPGYRG
jgi:uroporphyrinogen decarboxylase